MESTKFTVATVAIVCNDSGQMLITRRSQNESHAPGVYSYPGGKLEYVPDQMHTLEENVKKEVLEETGVSIKNLDYLSSHSFEKQNGDKVVVIAYIAQYESGEPTATQPEEIDLVRWIDSAEIEELVTIDRVKEVYLAALAKLKEQELLHHLTVAALVLNSKNEFLLIQTDRVKGNYTFPSTEVSKLAGSTWEILEKNLHKNILEKTGIQIADGPIPFTDQAFLSKDGFETIMQFYICKSTNQEDLDLSEKIHNLQLVWKSFQDFNPNEFEPRVYQVFEKAYKFVEQLSKF